MGAAPGPSWLSPSSSTHKECKESGGRKFPWTPHLQLGLGACPHLSEAPLLPRCPTCGVHAEWSADTPRRGSRVPVWASSV